MTPTNDGMVTLIELYRAMRQMRAFEEMCAIGVRDGDLRGELHLAIGQESNAAALLGNLRANDWVVGTHRSHPVALAKGIDPRLLMAEIFEKDSGLCRGKGGHLHLFSKGDRFSTTGIVGSSLPIALGHAYASLIENGNYISVGYTGDGGVNTGQFSETLNMAAIWKLPLVVIVENNGYGISVPAHEVTGGAGVRARAEAFGAWAERVDGIDVEDVAGAMQRAFYHARSGLGPAVVEILCSRFSGHYEGDPDHYRSETQKYEMRTRDPIEAAKLKLAERNGYTMDLLSGIDEEIRLRMEELLNDVRGDSPPDQFSATSGVFAEVISE